MDMEKIGLARLLDEFHAHRLGEEIEDAQIAHAEVSFFDDVVSGVNARREEIDSVIESKLGEQWKISRLDKTMLQILRAGTYELPALTCQRAASSTNIWTSPTRFLTPRMRSL